MGPVYLATQQNDLLGYLFIFTISEGECVMSREKVGRLLDSAGINSKEWLPSPVRHVDAFRRAVRAIKVVLPGGVYTLSKLNSSGDFLHGKIIYLSSNDVVAQEGRLDFNKKTGTVSYIADTPAAKMVAEEVVRLYDIYKARISSKSLRALVNNYLVSLGALPAIGSGGVYFLTPDRKKTLDCLVVFINSIGRKTEGHIIPLHPVKENVAYLNKKANDHLSLLIGKASKLLNKGELDRCNTDIFLSEVEYLLPTLRYLQVNNESLKLLHEAKQSLMLRVAGE